MLPVVLVVEDSLRWGEAYGRELESVCQVVVATDQRDAQAAFEQHLDRLAAIVMDACVPGEVPNTQDLTAMFRARFAGPIVAASSNPMYSMDLLNYGASEWTTKALVPRHVLRLLRLDA